MFGKILMNNAMHLILILGRTSRYVGIHLFYFYP